MDWAGPMKDLAQASGSVRITITIAIGRIASYTFAMIRRCESSTAAKRLLVRPFTIIPIIVE